MPATPWARLSSARKNFSNRWCLALGADAQAGVGYANADVVGCGAGLDGHAARQRVFNGVGDEVLQDLGDHVAAGVEGWQLGWHLKDQLELLGLGLGP